MRALAEEEQQDAVAFVAHEMAGPLQLLSLQLAALRRELAAHYEARRLASMGNAIEALRILSRDLLDADRICRGEFEMTFAPHEICALAAEVVEGFSCLAARRGILLSLVAVPDRFVVGCDRVRIAQALTNLIANAVKFSPIDSAILVRIKAVAERVLFSVTNAGPGVTLEHRHHVFERRWQAPGEDRGRGIGLFITRQIVERHGGSIWLEDADGEGTTFAFAIPSQAACVAGTEPR